MKYLLNKVLNFIFISIQNPVYNEILSMYFLRFLRCDYVSSILFSIYAAKVIMEGKLIVVAHTLRTYWFLIIKKRN